MWSSWAEIQPPRDRRSPPSGCAVWGCSGSEAGSYLRLIDFVYHSKKKVADLGGVGVSQEGAVLANVEAVQLQVLRMLQG